MFEDLLENYVNGNISDFRSGFSEMSTGMQMEFILYAYDTSSASVFRNMVMTLSAGVYSK